MKLWQLAIDSAQRNTRYHHNVNMTSAWYSQQSIDVLSMLKWCHLFILILWRHHGIMFFIEQLYINDPYNKMLARLPSQRFNRALSRWRLVVSVSQLQRQNGLTVSQNLWQNLCSFRWLKLSLRLFESLIPVGLCTSKIEFSSVLKYVKSDFLILETGGRFLSLASNLFHSLMRKWNKCYWSFLFCYRIE